MIKSTKTKLKIIAALTLVSVTIFSFFTGLFYKSNDNKQAEKQPAITEMINHKLPSAQTVEARFGSIFESNESNFVYRQNTLTRLPCAINGKGIAINIAFDATQEQKMIIQESFNEYNELFKMINPNYKFVCNFSPTEKDFKNPYSIKIQTTDSFEDKENGVGHSLINVMEKDNTIDGKEIYKSVITLDKRCLSSPQLFMGVIKHEIGHVLGLQDAYLNENATSNTIMQSGSQYGSSAYAAYTSLRNIDVKILDAMYRDPENKLSADEIESYLNSYELRNEFSYETYQLQQAFAEIQNQLKSINNDCLIESINASDHTKEIKNKIIQQLQNGLNIDNSFNNQNNICLGECERSSFDYTHISLNENQSIVSRKWDLNTSTKKQSFKNLNGLIFIGDNYAGDLYVNIGEFVINVKYSRDLLTNKLSIDPAIKKILQQTSMNKFEYFDQMLSLEENYELE